MSLTPTQSMSAPAACAARKRFLPIRPNPLIPADTAMKSSFLPVGVNLAGKVTYPEFRDVARFGVSMVRKADSDGGTHETTFGTFGGGHRRPGDGDRRRRRPRRGRRRRLGRARHHADADQHRAV